MRLLTDYTFYNSWQEEKLGIKAGDRFTVTHPIGELKRDTNVTYVGFDDVDNHYGIFVFKDQNNQALEISGDFSSLSEKFIMGFNRALHRI